MNCTYGGFISSDSVLPPIGENDWTLFCVDLTWEDEPVTISASCPEGQESKIGGGKLICVPCPSGSYSGASLPTCSECPAGKYLESSTASLEADACYTCPDGLISFPGSMFCVTEVHNWDFRGCVSGEKVGDSSEGR